MCHSKYAHSSILSYRYFRIRDHSKLLYVHQRLYTCKTFRRNEHCHQLLTFNSCNWFKQTAEGNVNYAETSCIYMNSDARRKALSACLFQNFISFMGTTVANKQAELMLFRYYQVVLEFEYALKRVHMTFDGIEKVANWESGETEKPIK